MRRKGPGFRSYGHHEKGICAEDDTTFGLLKACAKKKDLQHGINIHAQILKDGLLTKNPYLGSALISMYAKCGSLAKAQQVLEELPVRDTVTWNSLIGGYAQQGCSRDAFNCFEQMRKEGLYPNAVTFVCILKACGSARAVDKGVEIHREIISKGLLRHVEVGNALVDMYAKCGALAKAHEVLMGLLVRNAVSWNTLISGYMQNRQGEEALNCFEQMQNEGFSPDAITFTCILKACAHTGSLEKGMKFHEEIAGKGLLSADTMIGTALVDMYAKLGELARAQRVFDELPFRDVVTWCALISGYAEHGQGEEALDLYECMQRNGLFPNEITLSCILKACGSTGSLEKGMDIHDEIMAKGLLKTNIALGNALVDMYAKCGALEKAKQVLEELPIRDVVSWSALITGCTQQGQHAEALDCFERMEREGICPNAITFISVVKACGSMGEKRKGKQIHDEIAAKGLLQTSVELGNALVDMYAAQGELEKAEEVFDELSIEDAVSWNALISGYAQQGQLEGALNCFRRMQNEGLVPDTVTLLCILKVCSSGLIVDKGKQTHATISKEGFIEKDAFLGSALVDMYAKCGDLQTARKVFDQVAARNVICWNTLIAGYVQEGKGEEALECCDRMKREGFSPDTVTFLHMLKACGIMGAVDKAEQIHDELVRNGLVTAKDAALGAALVDAYVKCGESGKAQEVFDALPIRDAVTWNALISGYTQRGQGEGALSCFRRMQRDNISPDAVTFLCILTACSRCGLVQEGLTHFKSMSSRYGLQALIEHYTCVIDLLGRAGHLEEAMTLMKEMVPSSDYAAWSSLLAACEKWGNVKLGRLAFEHAVQLDNANSRSYVYMSSIYAKAGLLEEKEEIEKLHVRRSNQID